MMPFQKNISVFDPTPVKMTTPLIRSDFFGPDGGRINGGPVVETICVAWLCA